jgi:hypothetical protein
MKDGGLWSRALAVAVATTALSGCSIISPPLAVPDGSQCISQRDTAKQEATWFGVQITNLGTAPITLSSARLGESTGATLLDTLAIPEINDSTGDHLTLGTAGDLAADQPAMWAARQPVDGFVLQPDRRAAVAFRIIRSAGADVATVPTQHITYRVGNEPFTRSATSRQLIGIGDGGCEPTG